MAPLKPEGAPRAPLPLSAAAVAATSLQDYEAVPPTVMPSTRRVG